MAAAPFASKWTLDPPLLGGKIAQLIDVNMSLLALHCHSLRWQFGALGLGCAVVAGPWRGTAASSNTLNARLK